MSAPSGRAQGSHKPPFFDSDMRWQELANCTGLDVDLFYPERGVYDGQARKVCDNCDVQQQCLEFALKHGERYGLWGGMSESQRREVKRQRRQQPINHGTDAGYKQHQRRRSVPCESCKRAHTLADQIRTERRRA